MPSVSCAVKDLFFAIEVIGLCSFHDQFFGFFPCHSPLTAVGIITGVSCCAAAARIVGKDVINKILIATVSKLMWFARLKQKRVAGSNFGYSVLIANLAATGNDEIKFRFRRMRVIGAKRFALSVSALARDQTDAASIDRATPVRAQAQPKCSW